MPCFGAAVVSYGRDQDLIVRKIAPFTIPLEGI